MPALKVPCVITLLALSVLLALPRVAAGQDITLATRTRCDGNNVLYLGRSMKGQFKGQWADYIKGAKITRTLTAMNPGIVATLSNPISNWMSSTMDVVFRAGVDTVSYNLIGTVDIDVSPYLQPSYTRSFSGLKIFAIPALTGSSVPRADYYQTVDVTLTGANLNGANVASATARVDDTHPVVTYAGEAVQVSNGALIPTTIIGTPTRTQVVVRLLLPQKLTAVTVDFKVTGSNTDPCTPFGAGPGADPPPVVSRRVTLAVPTYSLPAPAYVQSIDVLNAKVGHDAEFTITLNKPVGRPTTVLFVWWKMAPSAVFTQASGSVGYDPNSFNRVEFSAGESVKRFKLRVVSLPPGAVNVGTVYLQTWSGDRTKNEAPGFFQKEFTVVK